MIIGVVKETLKGERRVAMVPDVVTRLVKAGIKVLVEAGAGEMAFFSDDSYEEAGANIVPDAESLWNQADVIFKVNPPIVTSVRDEIEMLHEGTILIGLLNPIGDSLLFKRLAEKKVTALSLEFIPRISRAQTMDALSSQASVAGYKAALIAANTLGKFFPMLTTAAGTAAPAKVFIIGAGVAGLQAIATAHRIGAIVEAFDIRPAVEEEVRSLGAKFVKVELKEDTVAEGGYAKEVSEAAKKREHDVLYEQVKKSDVVITTAQVPGKKAPVLLTEEMVAAMKPGSVIIDLAAEQGGNCEMTKAGEDVLYNGVKIIGPINLPSSMPSHSSQMFARNISALLNYLINDGKIHLDFQDDIIASCCITHNGEILNEKVRDMLENGFNK